MFDHNSIADIREEELVQYLLAVPYWRHWMFGHQGIPEDPIYRERVSPEAAPNGPKFKSDIDLVLCGRGRFDETVVYQVKRVKVSLSQLRFSAPGKLQDLDRGIMQTNLLVDSGFWKVYFYVIALIDARELNLLSGDENRPLFNEVRQKINSAIGHSIGTLKTRAGVFSTELVQLTDSPPTRFEQAGGHRIRPSTASLQSNELTKWVSEIFAFPQQA